MSFVIFLVFLKSNLAVFINNQLQTSVGQRAMVELRLRVLGLKVRFTAAFSVVRVLLAKLS